MATVTWASASDVAAQLVATANGMRDTLEQGGFTYNGWRFDSDATSVARITGAALAAQAALSAGEPFALDWTDADNETRQLDAAGVQAMQQALVLHANSCHEAARAIKADIEAGTITTREAVENDSRWPESGGDVGA